MADTLMEIYILCQDKTRTRRSQPNGKIVKLFLPEPGSTVELVLVAGQTLSRGSDRGLSDPDGIKWAVRGMRELVGVMLE